MEEAAGSVDRDEHESDIFIFAGQKSNVLFHMEDYTSRENATSNAPPVNLTGSVPANIRYQ